MLDILNKSKIIVVKESVRSLDIDDSIYFSKEYSDYISNSKLRLINPAEGGSLETYLKGLKPTFTNSLNLGSAIHELVLQDESFELSNQLKPSSKAGLMIDAIFKFRNKGYSIYESIIYASEEVDYYSNQLSLTRIKTLIKSGLDYYIYLYRNKNKSFNKEQIILDKRSRETCIKCVESVRRNLDAMNLLKNDDFSLDDIINKNEDTLLMDIIIRMPNSLTDPNAEMIEVPLKLKAKIDNWSINIDEKVVNLNDLKTTGKAWYLFPGSTVNETGEFVEGSFQHYHYHRQLACYKWMLSQYLISKGYTWDRFYLNIIAVQTIPNYASVLFRIPP